MVVLCVLLTACESAKPNDNFDAEYYDIDLKTITLDNYSLDDVKEMGYVVMENADVTCGQREWNNFVKMTGDGTPARIRTASYYTLDRDHVSEEYYEQNKDRYPVMYVKEIVFDGERYSVTQYEGDTCYSDTYSCLLKDVMNGDDVSTFKKHTVWFLCNDESLTYGKIMANMLDSSFHEWIKYEDVYSDYVYK